MLALSFAVLNRCDSEPARAMLQELAVRAEEVRGLGAKDVGGLATMS